MRCRVFTICLSMVLSPCVTAFAENWPSFRGPDGSGVGTGSPPERWDVNSGENIAWKVPVEGLGHASPVIWGERVFLATAVSTQSDPTLKIGLYGSGDSPDESGSWTWKIICVQKETGKRLWERTAHTGIPKQRRHMKATHANATPATNGELVVVMYGSEGLFAYDMEGNLKWKKDLGILESGPYDSPQLQWGFSSSPIIYKDRVIMQCDVLNGGFIAVLDILTGKEVLRIARDDVATWSTPLALTVQGRSQVICNGYKHIGGYDLETGSEIWKLKGGGDIPVPRPVLANDLIFISNAHGRMRPIYAVKTTATGDITPDERDQPSDGVAWWRSRLGSYIPTPIVYKGIAYVGNDRGILIALDAETGEEHYNQRVIEREGESYSASPVAAADKLYLTSEEGVIHVVQAGTEFRLLASNTMDGICMATPAISNGKLFVRTTTDLVCVESQ